MGPDGREKASNGHDTPLLIPVANNLTEAKTMSTLTILGEMVRHSTDSQQYDAECYDLRELLEEIERRELVSGEDMTCKYGITSPYDVCNIDTDEFSNVNNPTTPTNQPTTPTNHPYQPTKISLPRFRPTLIILNTPLPPHLCHFHHLLGRIRWVMMFSTVAAGMVLTLTCNWMTKMDPMLKWRFLKTSILKLKGKKQMIVLTGKIKILFFLNSTSKIWPKSIWTHSKNFYFRSVTFLTLLTLPNSGRG